MLTTPHRQNFRAARRWVIPALLIAWVAVQWWIWSESAMACMYPDPLPGGCPADEQIATARFGRWAGPVFVAGPVLALAASTAFAPNGRRSVPAWWLLGVTWILAVPVLVFDSLSIGYGCTVDQHCSVETEVEVALKMLGAEILAAAAPAVVALVEYRRGRKRTAVAMAFIAGSITVFMLLQLVPLLD